MTTWLLCVHVCILCNMPTVHTYYAAQWRGPMTPGSPLLVRILQFKLNFLHLYTFKICLKMHVGVLKILGLAIPMHTLTFS